MNILARVAVLGLLSFAGAGLLATQIFAVPDQAPTIKFIRADAGVFDGMVGERFAFTPASVVPYVVGQTYGWVMIVVTKKPRVRIREQFTLPQAPATWGEDDPTIRRTLSADRRTATSEQVMDVTEEGEIFQRYNIAEGDPKGSYVFRVQVEDEPVKTFRFEVR